MDATRQALQSNIVSLELNHKAEFKKIQSSFAVMNSKIDINHKKQSSHLLAFKKEVRHARRQSNQAFTKINKKLHKIDTRFKQIDSRFEQMEKRFDQIDQRIRKIEVRL